MNQSLLHTLPQSYFPFVSVVCILFKYSQSTRRFTHTARVRVQLTLLAMSSKCLPTVLIVPGAFHRVSSFKILISHLRTLGFSTIVAPYPSLNPSNPKCATSAAEVFSMSEKYLEPLIESQGKDVLMLVHSFGGVTGGGAATGYSKITRLSQGRKGGIIGLVYITGNIIPEGRSTIETLGGAYPPPIKTNMVRTCFDAISGCVT